jgi:hypothetical protein
MTTIYRFGLFVLLAAAPVLCQQPSQNYKPVGDKKIGSGETITTARIADPNELVGINGRIVKMSDLTSLLSLSDSLEGRSLHIPATSIDGKILPTLQQPTPDSKCPSAGRPEAGKVEGRADSCPLNKSADQAPHSKDQPHQPQQ